MSSPTIAPIDAQSFEGLFRQLDSNSGTAFRQAYAEVEIAVRRSLKSEGQVGLEKLRSVIPAGAALASNHFHDICREAGVSFAQPARVAAEAAPVVSLVSAQLPVPSEASVSQAGVEDLAEVQVVSPEEVPVPVPVAPAPKRSNAEVSASPHPRTTTEDWIAEFLAEATRAQALEKLLRASDPKIAQDVLKGLLAVQRAGTASNSFLVAETHFCSALSQVADQIFPELLRCTGSSSCDGELKVLSRLINGLSSSNFSTFVSHAMGEDLEYSGKFMRVALSNTELKGRTARIPSNLLMLAFKRPQLLDNGEFLSQAIIAKILAEAEQQNPSVFNASLRELKNHPHLAADLKAKITQAPLISQSNARSGKRTHRSNQLSDETQKIITQFSQATKPEFKKALIDRLRKEYLSTAKLDGQTISLGTEDLFQAIRTMAESRKGLRVVTWIAMEQEPTLEQRHARLLLLSLAARSVIRYKQIPATILRWGLEPDNIIVLPGHCEKLMEILAPTNKVPTE